MRTLSAEAIKAMARGRKPRGHAQDRPTEGTYIRGVYDQLMANRGSCVSLTIGKKHKGVIEVLRSTYGLDVRAVRSGHRGYILVGEWCGRVYVDYLAEKIDEQKTVS